MVDGCHMIDKRFPLRHHPTEMPKLHIGTPLAPVGLVADARG